MSQVNVKGVSVDNKPRKDGRWQARYNGKSIYGETRKEVEQKVIGISQNKIVQENDSSNMLYNKWIEEWMRLYK
ncbi:MAG: hypothetical protein RR086_03575, partial [Clostridia bacterium]